MTTKGWVVLWSLGMAIGGGRAVTGLAMGIDDEKNLMTPTEKANYA
jgi:hypothetical protein